jgi:predicted Zn-dependent protease
MNRFYTIILLLCSLNFIKAQSINYDIQMGKEAHEEIVNTIGIYQHPSQAYIKKVGNRLAATLQKKQFNFRFFIIDMKEPNAMALPGGYIYISRGILPIINSEDELAGVMGHEIIHAYFRHSVKSMKQGILPAVLQIPGNIIHEVISPELGNLINSPIKFTSEIFGSTYSRQHENEADEYGIIVAAKAGYQPEALMNVLDRLEKVTQLETNEEAKFSFFDSHPMTKKRVQHIKKKASSTKIIAQKAFIANKNDFIKQFDGICIKDNPAHGIFRENVFLHPDMGFVIEFPEGWLTANSPQMVGAVDSTKKAQLFLGVKSEQKEPVFYAKNAKENIDTAKVIFINDKKTKVNGKDAYIISLKGKEDTKENLVIHMLWVNMNKYTFLFIAAGDSTYNKVLKKAVFSLRPITQEERKSIKTTVLKIVEAKEGETLESLSKRTGNVLDKDYLSIINDIDKSVKLKKEQAVKIGIEENYKGNR